MTMVHNSLYIYVKTVYNMFIKKVGI